MNFKPTIKRTALPYLVLGAGGVGLVLRVLLYTLGQDAGGLLPRFHFLHILCLLLSAAVVLALVRTVKQLGVANRYRANFPASAPSALAIFCAALWLLPAAFAILRQAGSLLDYLHGALAFLSVGSMAVTAWLRLRGKRPNFLFHFVLCLFFALNMVCQYRQWSANPQLPDYLFHIFACVFLALTAYYRTAFDLGMGRREIYLFCNLMSVYLCFLCLVGAGDLRLYLAGGLWALGNQCPIEPPKPRHLNDTIRIPNIQERP